MASNAPAEKAQGDGNSNASTTPPGSQTLTGKQEHCSLPPDEEETPRREGG